MTCALTALALAACSGDRGGPGAQRAREAVRSPGDTAFNYDTHGAEVATYWASLSTLAHAIMFSGLGEQIEMSMDERDEWLKRAGFTRRPAMGELAVVGPVYAAGWPGFVAAPDYADPSTLRWDPATFDRTLDPGVQAWALLKITSPEFHLQYHDLPENRLAALMMIPQARAQARLLEDQLLTPRGVFAPRRPDGRFAAPEPRDQVAVLWAVSSLIAAAASDAEDYWHAAYRDFVDPDSYRRLARAALAAVRTLPPDDPGSRALGIEALGRYALVARAEDRMGALRLARELADSLMHVPASAGLADVALSIYGLVEASRLFGDDGFAEAAARIFRERMLPRWDDALGVFRNRAEDPSVSYTPFTAAAVVAALDALRWYGAPELRARAEALYPAFFEGALVRSGLLLASPLPLVQEAYLKEEPASSFAHPLLPMPHEAGMAPVFASRVEYREGGWVVTDTMFRAGEALLLSNILTVRSDERADTFLPAEAIASLRVR
jgi:hypothetical protein